MAGYAVYYSSDGSTSTTQRKTYEIDQSAYTDKAAANITKYRVTSNSKLNTQNFKKYSEANLVPDATYDGPSTASYKDNEKQKIHNYLVREGKLPWEAELTGGRSLNSSGTYDLDNTPDGIYLDYANSNTDTRKAIINGVGLYESDVSYDYFLRTAKFYNRYKMPYPDSVLQRSFAHVFFVKPNCNIIKKSTDSSVTLTDAVANRPDFKYCNEHAPDILRELTQGHELTKSDFSFVLSNAAESFTLSDESIETDTYGKSLTGHQIVYGKHDIASKTAGEFTISLRDDRELHIYELIKLWTSYISGCYQGLISPVRNNIRSHTLDYAGALYYILTAEDGETILFWSKYYGIFPVNSPSSMFGWSYGNLLAAPKYDVTFKYSFKVDYDPTTMLEFNSNSYLGNQLGTTSSSVAYLTNYDSNVLSGGRTWVATPFIEQIRDSSNNLIFKLRFRVPDKSNYGAADNHWS